MTCPDLTDHSLSNYDDYDNYVAYGDYDGVVIAGEGMKEYQEHDVILSDIVPPQTIPDESSTERDPANPRPSLSCSSDASEFSRPFSGTCVQPAVSHGIKSNQIKSCPARLMLMAGCSHATHERLYDQMFKYCLFYQLARDYLTVLPCQLSRTAQDSLGSAHFLRSAQDIRQPNFAWGRGPGYHRCPGVWQRLPRGLCPL